MKNLILSFCFFIFYCGTVPSVRPIGKGRQSVTLSSGGPVAPVFGIKMPIPYSVLRYRKGITDNLDFHTGMHLTMFYLGNLGIDVGGTKHILEQNKWKPSLSIEGSIYGFYHFNALSSIRLYPEFSFIGNYSKDNRQTLYFGIQNMLQVAKPYWVPLLLIGFEIPFKDKFIFNLETKWFAPFEESENRVVDYTFKPFSYGALGFIWGLSYKF